MCKEFEKLLYKYKAEGQAEGKAEGKAEGLTLGKVQQAMATAITMHKEGMSVALISKCVNFSEKEVNEWLAASAV